MNIPRRLPGLRLFMIFTAVYGVVWISLEGDLLRVSVLGTAVSLILTGYLVQRYLGGWQLGIMGWLSVTGLGGLLAGFGSGLLTLIFMAMKTGLHGHGPEFRPSEIEFVVEMVPLWTAAGLLAGLGVGVVLWGLKARTFTKEGEQ